MAGAEMASLDRDPGFHLLFSRSPVAMFVYDRATLQLLEVNEAALRQYGYTRDEFLSLHLTDIRLGEEVPDRPPGAPQEDRAAGPPGPRRHRRKDGRTILVDAAMFTVTFAGRPAAVVVARDVTEQVATERALRESEARYRDLFDNATDIIYTLDAAGRFTGANRAAVRLTGYTTEEVLQLDFSRVVAPEYLDLAREMLARRLAGETTPPYEIEILAKDGRRIPVELSGRVIYRDGAPIEVHGIARDISERKRAEAELRERARLMDRLVSLGALLNRALIVREVLRAIGFGASYLSGTGHVAIYVRRPDGRIECPWYQGLPARLIAQALAHYRDLIPGRLMQEGGAPEQLELPGGRVVQATRPFLIPDIEALPRDHAMARLADAAGMRANGHWPLLYEGRVIGDISCFYEEPRAWSAAEEEIFLAFCAQAAVALENARLHEAQVRRTAELEHLFELSKRLRTARASTDMYPILTEHVARLLRADGAWITLLDAERQTLTVVGSSGSLPVPSQASAPLADSISGRAVRTGAVYRADDLAREALPSWPDPLFYRFVGPVLIAAVRAEEETVGTIGVARLRGAGTAPFDEESARLLEGIADIAGSAIKRARLHEHLQQTYVQTVLALAQAIESRDAYTGGHGIRMLALAEDIAREVGCDEDEIRDIRWGERLHDIGKIGVPDAILNKPAELTQAEWAAMRQHPVTGEAILRPIEHMRGVAGLVRHHQERWDGSGYPDGLRGQAIPLGSRILAVVDAYGAITEDRPYKPARTHDEAVAEIRRCAGSQFDPRVVEAFCRVVARHRADSS